MCACVCARVVHVTQFEHGGQRRSFVASPFVLLSLFAWVLGMELSCQDLAVNALPAEPSSGPWWAVLNGHDSEV